VAAVVVIEERLFDRARYRSSFTKEQVDDAAERGDMLLLDAALREEWRGPHESREFMWIEHEVFVIHNPFAAMRIGEDVFAPFPQLVPRDDGTMAWTDNPNGGADDEDQP
jgi:hypothetical protein